MLKNFLKIAWRNLLRKKSFSFINIAGLSIGMASATLIILWIINETTYDRFYKDLNRIYSVYNRDELNGKIGCWSNTPKVMGKVIQSDYPEVSAVTRVNWTYPLLIGNGEKKMKIDGTMVDSSFLRVFSFPMIKGNRSTALNDMYSIVITEKMAKKVFGNEDPIGKVIKVDNLDNFTVTGLLKDLPNNTSFNFEFLIPWAYMRHRGWDDEEWENNSIVTYVQLKEGVSPDAFNAKFKDFRRRHSKQANPKAEVFLYPLSRIHLYGNFENGVESGSGRIESVRLFGIIAGLILLIACINFMNLSTARSEKRAKEVGIRKVVGAQKRALIFQFLGESILLSFIAGIIALLIVYITLPSFNTLVQKQLVLDFSATRFWLWSIVFVLMTGVLAGSYPAAYLASFKPVRVLKGTFKATNALVTPRKILVIGQFTFAIMLIIATIIIRQQMKNAQDRQVGYSKDNLLYVILEGDMEKNYNSIKNEMLASNLASSVTKTSSPITEGWSNTWGMEWKGKDPNDRTIINRLCVDDQIVKTTGLQLAEGRDIDLNRYPTDSTAMILNEAAVKAMGFKQPIGQVVKDNGTDWHVIGVVKDFILDSPYKPIIPIAIEGAKGWFNVIHVKFTPNTAMMDNIKRTEAIFKKYNPEYPFNYNFVDTAYAKKFENEKRTGTMATIFALLAIVISCLGLFGLSSYMAENRIKEIGIRKVLGASVTNITRLLSKDFLRLVLVAFVIAAPLSYWAMHSWLQDFPYRVTIQWWVFILAGCGAVAIALLTVSFQAIKAAIANPVKSLRTE